VRTPSVYAWGWIMVPGRFLVLFGALAAAAVIQSLFVDVDVLWWVFFPCFFAFSAIAMKLTSCPRCGRNCYARSGWMQNDLWPAVRCSKCGLDLKAFGPSTGGWGRRPRSASGR
jgi:hypothetical protein